MQNDNYGTDNLLLTLLEDERSRIARELHDLTIQGLVRAIYQTEIISRKMENDIVSAKLELALLTNNLKENINNTRNLIYDLKPMAINDLGFQGALDEYFTYLKSFSEIHFSYEIHEDLIHLTDKELLTLFRILQEACINAVKHSEASDVVISISEYNLNFYKVLVDDNGKGCDPDSIIKENHYGLIILKERVQSIKGECKINTDINEGFHITVILPMTC
jgi:two-component system sensor histidine kinase DegS